MTDDVQGIIDGLTQIEAYFTRRAKEARDGTIHAKCAEVAQATIEWLRLHETHVLSAEEILDGMTPDVIWIEFAGDDDIYAGVFNGDYYDMAGGDYMDTLDDEITRNPDAYNATWRAWYPSKPSEAQKEAAPWQ